MTGYVELASDHAFTIWLATRTPGKVRAEAHVRLSPPERKVLAFHQQHVSKPVAPPKPVRQQFTERQLQIAMAALNNTKEK